MNIELIPPMVLWPYMIAAFPALITAVIGLMTFITSRRGAMLAASAADSSKQAVAQVAIVHEIVNSQRTEMQTQIKVLTDRVEGLYKRLNDKDVVIAVLTEQKEAGKS